MGNSLSCGLYNALPKSPVVKLVHSNGLVEEFYRSVCVRELSVDYPHHFICSAAALRSMHSGKLHRLSEEDSMKLGQIYFLLPAVVFDLPLTEADISALFSKAGVARKASYKELSVHVQQVSPLAVQETEEMELKMPPHPQELPFSKELIRKLIEETRLQLQEATMRSPHGTCASKGQTMLPELLQAAYARHILARSCSKLWRPPLETIEEGSVSIS